MQRFVPAIVAGALALFAAIAAIGVNQVVAGLAVLPEGAVLEEVEGQPAAGAPAVASARPPQARAKSKKQYVDEILGRNIFDHTKVGLRSTVATAGDGSPTDLKVRLVATLVAEPAEFSSALIADDGDTSIAHGYGIGDKLHDAEVIEIKQRLVKLRRSNGAVETLSMAEDDSPRPKSVTKGGDDEGVEKLGENKFAVDRSMVEQYLGDLDAVSRMARAIPHRGSDGQIDGYRLSGIRRNSPLDKLGIKNGDIVHAVNGQGLTSMQGAMSAYSSLQNDSSFSFDITRRGKKQNMEYEVR